MIDEKYESMPIYINFGDRLGECKLTLTNQIIDNPTICISSKKISFTSTPSLII